MLNYNLCDSIRRVQEFLLANNDLNLSLKGINEALQRVGNACKNEYAAIQDRMRRSKWVLIDETGFRGTERNTGCAHSDLQGMTFLS